MILKRLLLATLLANSVAQRDVTLTNYLVSVIWNLAARYPGVHQCVFFGTQRESSFDNTLGQVLQDPRLDFVTRSVITVDFQVEWAETVRYPLVLLIEGENIKQNLSKFVRIMIDVKPSSKVVVLFTVFGDYLKYARYLRILEEHEVLFIDVRLHHTIISDIGSKTALNLLPNPDDLFSNNLSRRYNLRGKPVKYMHRTSNTFIMTVWISETADFMNTTVEQVFHSCKLSVDNMFDPCYFNSMKDEKVDIDLTGIVLEVNDKLFVSFEILETSIITGDLIAVPRSALTMVQLFTMPFSWQVWTTLVLILVTAEITHLIFPSSIENDPILLVVCGYERHDLHRARQLEKLLLMPLIVLMFFMASAYETKLLSMMTSKPAAQNIRTVQDLIDAGIKIKIDLRNNFFPMNHSVIQGALVNSTVDVFNMDMVHAYFLQRSTAETLAGLYYDPNQRIHRYAILNEPFIVQPVCFMLGRRNPLKEVFRHTLDILIESGLYAYIEKCSINLEKSLLAPKYNHSLEYEAMLYFADFQPVWILFAFGCGISFVAYTIEVASREIMSKLSAQQNDKTKKLKNKNFKLFLFNRLPFTITPQKVSCLRTN